MPVGILILDVYMPQVRTLKEKRSIIKGVIDRTRNKYNVSAVETDFHNTLQRSQLTVATAGSDTSAIDSTLSEIISFIQTSTAAKILDSQKHFWAQAK